MMFAVGYVSAVCSAVILGNFVGWLSVDRETHPWNWRALFGPWWYHSWLQKKYRIHCEG